MEASIQKICDPESFRLEEAIHRAKLSAQASPGFEIELVRFLQAQCLSSRVSLPVVFRGLDVMGGMTTGVAGRAADEGRLVTILRPFLRSSNPQIVSKTVLVLGRQARSFAWVNGFMSESDDRIRANLIESLWNRKEPEVELVLRGVIRDSNPRVAANAVYGLYLLGIEEWVPGLERLVASRDVPNRLSGIWVLKESGVPDAPARLKLLIRDSDADVRRAAFAALVQLRERGAKLKPDVAAACG